jgi:lipopolysaccharide heptosyltransferase II
LNTGLEKSVIAELEAGGRILISRLHYLGDIVLTLPLVQALHERFPEASIDYLARGAAADILRGEPMIDTVWQLPERGSRRGGTWGLVRALRRRRYAAAIDLYTNPRSALLLRMSGARLRIGGSRRGRRRMFTHPIVVPREVRSATEHHLFHARPLDVSGVPLKPALTISNEEKVSAQETLRKLGVEPDRPAVGIHPGGKWEVKRWPAENFAKLAERLSREHGVQIVVLCGPGEEVYRDAVRDRLRKDTACYVPTLPIRETAAVISLLDGIAVCDGGIMHVAAAVGTPTVGIFGSSEPDVWFPYEAYGPFTAAWVPISCRPCHSHVCSHVSCLQRVTVEVVEQKLLRVVFDGRSLGAGSH